MDARQHFSALLEHLQAHVVGEEGFTLAYGAEVSSFIRFNQGQVRQAGDVQQVYVTLSLYQASAMPKANWRSVACSMRICCACSR